MDKILIWTTVIVVMVLSVRFFKRKNKNSIAAPVPALENCSRKLVRPGRQ